MSKAHYADTVINEAFGALDLRSSQVAKIDRRLEKIRPTLPESDREDVDRLRSTLRNFRSSSRQDSEIEYIEPARVKQNKAFRQIDTYVDETETPSVKEFVKLFLTDHDTTNYKPFFKVGRRYVYITTFRDPAHDINVWVRCGRKGSGKKGKGFTIREVAELIATADRTSDDVTFYVYRMEIDDELVDSLRSYSTRLKDANGDIPGTAFRYILDGGEIKVRSKKSKQALLPGKKKNLLGPMKNGGGTVRRELLD